MKLTSQSKREVILRAAEGIFLKKGFFPTRVDDIARAAKVAKGTVYLYFPDKESIYLALFAQKIDEGISFLKTVAKGSAPPKMKLTRIFDHWLSNLAKSKGLSSFFSIENINLGEKIVKRVRCEVFPRVKEMMRIIAQIIREGIERKEFRKTNPELTALSFLHLVHLGLIYQAFTGKLKEEKEVIKDLFFKGVER